MVKFILALAIVVAALGLLWLLVEALALPMTWRYAVMVIALIGILVAAYRKYGGDLP